MVKRTLQLSNQNSNNVIEADHIISENTQNNEAFDTYTDDNNMMVLKHQPEWNSA